MLQLAVHEAKALDATKHLSLSIMHQLSKQVTPFQLTNSVAIFTTIYKIYNHRKAEVKLLVING